MEYNLSAGGFDVTDKTVFADILANGLFSIGCNGKRMFDLFHQLLKKPTPGHFRNDFQVKLQIMNEVALHDCFQ